jgi:hypothetical protein
MSQLQANTPLTYEVGDLNAVPVKGSSEIFLGSAVGITSGFGRQLVAGDIFGGFAEQHINNTGADGALAVPVKRRGQVQLAISALAVTDVGKPVYASDGATFTLTQSTNTRVGYVVRWVSTGVGIVCFDVRIPQSPTITDSTGGTASTTFAAIAAGGAYAQADIVAIKNALSQIALTLNA